MSLGTFDAEQNGMNNTIDKFFWFSMIFSPITLTAVDPSALCPCLFVATHE